MIKLPLPTDHRLLCVDLVPCVVRSNKAGQLVWQFLTETNLFHLSIRLNGHCWQSFVIPESSPAFLPICRALRQ